MLDGSGVNLPSRIGLRTKLMASCALAITAVLVVTSAYQYTARRTEPRPSLGASLDAAAARLSNNLAASVWDLRGDEALVLLNAELASPDVAGIVITAEEDKIFAAVAKRGAAVAEAKDGSEAAWRAALGPRLASRPFEVRRNGRAIAKGEILYPEEAVARRLREQLLGATAQVVLADGVLALVLLYVLSALLFRPLHVAAAEAASVRAAVSRGELGTCADVGRVPQEFRPMLDGLNEVLEAVVAPVRVASRYLDRLSKGEVPPPLREPYQGDFNAIQDALNR